ncbi:MAG TPA: phosphoribosyltransferase family protein [Rhodocyclaceae bacterium]|nr:phosphoribosyltransferase family protein [Rhodocyclaceae bacterium]HRQ46256.1 phosphoribosyltransferase family protein [Rhodocyclaceae bacterium]
MALFDSRSDAAQQLASALSAFRHRNPLILAIPRGAVEMGRILADRLGGEVDVVLVRKLGAPGNPEFAVGAVDETGWMYVADHAAIAGADAAYLAAERERQLDLLRQRRALYTPSRPPIDPKGRVVIVVDDGLATGATMIAALHAARAKEPAHLVCAVPVAAPDSLRTVRSHADELVYLDAPYYFQAVGQFYRDFPQVSDEQVVSLLEKPRQVPPGPV